MTAFRMRPAPELCGEDTINQIVDTATLLDSEPPGVGIPVSRETPDEAVCPSCKIFEREPHAEMCPRCTLRAGIRGAKVARQREHDDSVRRELAERAAMLKRAERQVLADAEMVADAQLGPMERTP